jgi:hypothetical protein
MPGNFGTARPIDFSALGQIGQQFGGIIKNRRLSNALSALGPDATWEERARAIEQIDPKLGLEYDMRNSRSNAIGDPQAGFRWSADGTSQEFIPGSGEDPAVIKLQAEARGGPGGRVLPRIAINDLTEKGSTIEVMGGLSDTFMDGFAGWKVGAAGDAANKVASNTGLGNKEAAAWWKDYQYQANITRQKLFGSALTAQEKSQWDKANIDPGMTDDAVRTNLATRRKIEMKAARKLARVYLKSGYPREAIEEAVGISLDDDPTPAPTGEVPVQKVTTVPFGPAGDTPTLDANPGYQADMASGRYSTKASAQPKPEHVSKLKELLAQYPDPKDQAEIMDEWERKYPQYGRGAADAVLGRDVQAGR